MRKTPLNQGYASREVTPGADFFVEEAIMVEIKALSKPDDSNLNQAINHLEAFNLEIGLLINFGAKSLEFKRVINSKPKPQTNQSTQRNQ